MNFISSSECPSALIQTVNRLGIVPGSDTKCSSEIVFKQSILRHFTFTSTQHRDSLSVANIMTLFGQIRLNFFSSLSFICIFTSFEFSGRGRDPWCRSPGATAAA